MNSTSSTTSLNYSRAWTPWRSALLISAVGVISAMHVGKLPVAIPYLQAALDITLFQAGWLLSIVQVAGMLLGLIVGLMADRLGPRTLMLAGLVILGLSSAAGAVSTGVTMLMITRVGESVGFLLSVLPAPALIRQVTSEPAMLQRAMGLWGTYMPAGIALSILLGSIFLESIDWRFLWIFLAFLTGVSAVFLQWFIPAVHEQKTVPAFADRVRCTLHSPGPWIVAIGFFLYSGQWLAVIGFLPTIYSEAGITGWQMGVVSAFAVGINVTGSLAAGRLIGGGFPAHRILAIGYAGMAVGSVLAFVVSGSPAVQYLGVLAFSTSSGVVAGSLFGQAIALSPSRDTVATTVGWMQQLNSTGQFFGPPVVAALAHEAGGWHLTWVATVICSTLGIGLSMLIPIAHRAQYNQHKEAESA